VKSEDTALLTSVVTALNNLRAQGTAVGADVRQVTVTIHQTPAIRFIWNDTNLDWDIQMD